MFSIRSFIIYLAALCSSIAQEPAPVAPQPKEDHVRVAVLGYHDFSSTRKIQEMLIRPSKFRSQMQAIKDLKLNVISLEDFVLWKQGKKNIPDKSVLITIDDGWKSVYTEAYPILKEFNYPFTLYLYTNYINRGGRSMTSEMIKEMMENGCTIGSHSVSHPMPSTIRKHQREGADGYKKFIDTELGASKKILESTFNQPINSYVYPGGIHTPEMYVTAAEVGYQHLFTVKPGKVTRKKDDNILPRYIILGEDKHDYIFKHATTFSANAISRGTSGAVFKKEMAHPVSPSAGEKISHRMPNITANLSKVENLDEASIVMRVAGFGKVPATYDPETQISSWKVNRRLRSQHCSASVQWKLIDAESYQPLMEWTFVIDKEAAYTPKTAPALP
ncbi:MAG: peptidoglycan/xylan/chitin deacetylase (PgdA/CDA1 family) [Rubritalea sp.]|jgi:peptidoglycan/xylan/chitin deacetylase (PgdA/CDA1 family)